jgi:ankyrin repeat protein
MVQVFLDAGMSVESPVLNGYTPLQLAASDNRNIEVVEALVDRGANVSVYDETGKSLLAQVQDRIDASDGYLFISDDVNARVLKKLAP